MPVKLNSSGGGSVTLDVPSTASTFTLNLPAQSGSVVAADASGNVGIGTTTPTSPLTIANASANPLLALNATGTQDNAIQLARGGVLHGAVYQENAGTLNLRNFTAQPTAFWTNNIERARITADGNFQFNSGYGSVATAFGCRAWVNFNGTGTVAIRASGNVSSITDNGTGEYTINFTNAMPDANYSWSFGANNTANDTSNNSTVAMTTTTNQTLSSLRIVTKTIVGGGAQGSADVSLINILVLR